VAANFATDELGAKKAAVLYDIAADYPKGLAEFFKAAFEEIHGPVPLWPSKALPPATRIFPPR
jgi:ABC-type branched-subunit amino acid transport system substrate-binding protein